MEKGTFWGYTVLGITIGLGICVAGLSMSHALFEARASQRYVTVKGLAEREVDADLVIWPLTFEVSSNDLNDLQAQVETKRGAIRRFLADAGFEEAEISQSTPRIRDTQSEYYGDRAAPRMRYIAQSTVTLRTGKVPVVKAAIEKAGDLIGEGIVLVGENYGRSTEFLFTGLNDIKPAMIEEATKNARTAAEQFAKDSGSGVGKIRTATQGLFSITDRDMNSPDRKNVRVVTTVEYYLSD
ncbi:MAG: SIMPL domain-containing protein [Candidatus Krumholzibacteria bacterium]|nr:SIMPL domain-containing protein [Candidatus Krumholzibacteria bacterium]